jgi:hypothetical protein
MLQQFQAAGFTKSEWDGMAIMEAESYAKLMEASFPTAESAPSYRDANPPKSQGFQSVLASDAEKFMNVSEAQFIPLDLITPIDRA